MCIKCIITLKRKIEAFIDVFDRIAVGLVLSTKVLNFFHFICTRNRHCRIISFGSCQSASFILPWLQNLIPKYSIWIIFSIIWLLTTSLHLHGPTAITIYFSFSRWNDFHLKHPRELKYERSVTKYDQNRSLPTKKTE